jgi:type I restriction enzyme S subunit
LWLKSPLFSEQLDRGNGATVDTLTIQKLQSVDLRLPPLAEQQRIVGVLNEGFGGIAAAKANAEKNLQNARALFESHLQSVFTQGSDGWMDKPFEDCIEDVRYTTKIQRKEFLECGKFPIISQEADFINGYWNDSTEIFKIHRPVVIFGDHTQILKYVDFDFVLGADGVKILSSKDFLIPKFLFYSLRSKPLKSLGYSRHYRLLKELRISYPNADKQVQIAEELDALEAEIRRLKFIYQQKIDALQELKKSLLYEAFTGEL